MSWVDRMDQDTSLPVVFMRGWAAGYAQAIEARRAATGNTDAVEDESAVPTGCARKDPA